MKLKNALYLALICAGLTACQQKSQTASTNKVAPADAGVMTFEKEIYDFGSIASGEKVHYDFKFKNTGKSPLIITDATATCGCTVPETPKDPIRPGEEGVIKVIFNSEGKYGLVDKVVTITSNGNPSQNLVHIVGQIREPGK